MIRKIMIYFSLELMNLLTVNPLVIIKPHGFDATYMLLYFNGKKQFKGRIGQFELNHTPPKSAYQYTPFIDINPDLMPVMLIQSHILIAL